MQVNFRWHNWPWRKRHFHLFDEMLILWWSWSSLITKSRKRLIQTINNYSCFFLFTFKLALIREIVWIVFRRNIVNSNIRNHLRVNNRVFKIWKGVFVSTVCYWYRNCGLLTTFVFYIIEWLGNGIGSNKGTFQFNIVKRCRFIILLCLFITLSPKLRLDRIINMLQFPELRILLLKIVHLLFKLELVDFVLEM